MKLARFLKLICLKYNTHPSNSSYAPKSKYKIIREKIDSFIKGLEEDGIEYIEISLSGNADIFDPKREIDSITLKVSLKVFDVQYYIPPSKKIDATVFLRSERNKK